MPVTGVLALLGVVAALGAGDSPPTVAASAPLWTGAHTLEFAFAQYPEWNGSPYVVNDDGSGLAPTAPPSDPTLSPDDRHRYVIDPITNVLSIDGRSTRRDVFVQSASSAAWSPDSTRLAYVSAGRIWVTNADGSGQHSVHAGTMVAWVSPDELVVGLGAFDADVDVMRVDGTRARRVVTGASSVGGLAVSPDGTQLAFTALFGSAWGHGSTLYVARLDGLDSDVRRLSPDLCGCGTDGPDRIIGSKVGDLLIGGAGDDVIHAGDGQNYVYGQWGNDTILTGSYYDTVWGGGGNDVIRTGAGEDTIYPGPGRDVVDAGRGPDHVIANDGERDVIDCGPGDDEARVDKIDVVRNCEHVTIAPPNAIP
jgi:Ca2+-binding RTX toxin-like protein